MDDLKAYTKSSPDVPIREGIYERLVRERLNLAKRLKDLDEVISGLEKNPEVSDLLNKLSKVTHF
jgi:hypothetical protein